MHGPTPHPASDRQWLASKAVDRVPSAAPQMLHGCSGLLRSCLRTFPWHGIFLCRMNLAPSTQQSCLNLICEIAVFLLYCTYFGIKEHQVTIMDLNLTFYIQSFMRKKGRCANKVPRYMNKFSCFMKAIVSLCNIHETKNCISESKSFNTLNGIAHFTDLQKLSPTVHF